MHLTYLLLLLVPPSLAHPPASPFPLSSVSLTSGLLPANQNRTVAYLLDVSVDRLLYNFRFNHKLSTNGAAPNGGWDAPNFPFRTHMQGHFLTAWAQCHIALGLPECRSRTENFVAALAKCQANNAAAGFASGYLSGFPESDFDLLDRRELKSGNVPYYAVHKTMAGLLDVWRLLGSTAARDVLRGMAGWVDTRTAKLSYAQMQAVLGTEFGGMGDVLAELAQMDASNRVRWLGVAKRFDHASIMDPLAAGKDALSGLHANTQVPKWIGAAREYVLTGEDRYRAVAVNAWEATVRHHTYAIGGNSQAEHFRARDAISGFLRNDTAEACNTYNMLKLTRDLWTLSTNATATGTEHFDFYELALLNHLIPAQNPASAHGHITYFTPLNPGGRRGVGPAWGGGTWSTDYNSFWCCQGTQIETNTKLMDSIYFQQDVDGEGLLWVHLFVGSVVKWESRGVVVRQNTAFPAGDGTELVVEKAGATAWRLKVRIPTWAAGAEVSVNGQRVEGTVKSGTYVEVKRAWKDGDKVSVKLPRRLRLVAANDKPGVAAVAYGPVILSGKYGDTVVTAMPGLALGSIKATQKPLEFTAQADGKTVTLGPFHEAHGHNYNVYWAVSGQLG